MGAVQEAESLKSAGFSDEEISTWGYQRRQELTDAGFRQDEIDKYFGVPVEPLLPGPPAGETESELMQGIRKVGGVVAWVQQKIAGATAKVPGLGPILEGDAILGDYMKAAIAGQIGPVTADELVEKMAKDRVRGPVPLGATALDMVLQEPAGKVWAAAAKTFAEFMTPLNALLAGLPGAVARKPLVITEAAKDASVNLMGSEKLAEKFQTVQQRTGKTPNEVLEDAASDVTITQDLASKNIDVPRAYKQYDKGAGTEPPKPPTEPPKEPGAEPPPDKLQNVTEAQNAVLSRVVKERPEVEGMTWDKFYTATVDNLNPIKIAVEESGKELAASENPYTLERLTRGIMGKGKQFIEHGTYDFTTYANTEKSYTAIMEPVKNDLDGFRAYMAARRALEIEGKGLESGVPLDQAKLVVEAGRRKYEPVFQDRLKYREALIDTLQESGILKPEAVEAMREANQAYVPFYRFFEDMERSASAKGVRNPIKKQVGSERKIIDPLESDIKDTFLFLALAEKNAARQAFVRLGEGFAERVKTPIKPIQIPKEEIERIAGVEIPEDVMTIFRPQSLIAGKNEIVVFEKGQRHVYAVDPAVAEAFNATDRLSASFLANMLNTPAVLLRAGTVVNPEFISRNVIRDALDAFIYAGSNPIKTALGAKSLITKDTAYQNWLKGGGANATMVAMDRNYISHHLFDLNIKTGLMERAWNVARSPMDLLQATSELAENMTRLGAVRSEMLKAKTKAQIQALSLISREATVDFSRHGADPALQQYTHMTAFMNPGIQGLDRMVRAITENPKGTIAKAFVAVTIPSLLLWWANRDDEQIQALPNWQKNLFWTARMPTPPPFRDVQGETFIMRIPKPFGLGLLFGSLPERLLDAAVTSNPRILKDLEETMTQAFGFNAIPTWMTPLIEQFSNTSLFIGNPLVPPGQERFLPEYQYTEYTTETAKELAKLIGAFPGIRNASTRDDNPISGGVARALDTPILIENYVRAWTGGVGVHALKLADLGLRQAHVVPDPVLPAATLADIPVIKAFVVRYPTAGVQPIQDFYTEYYAKQKVYNTFMAKAKEGDNDAVERVHAIDQTAWDEMSGLRDTLTDLSSLIRMIYKNPDFTRDEKRQFIDTLYFRMIELAKDGNRAFQDMKASFE